MSFFLIYYHKFNYKIKENTPTLNWKLKQQLQEMLKQEQQEMQRQQEMQEGLAMAQAAAPAAEAAKNLTAAANDSNPAITSWLGVPGGWE